jgi:hypothetical protein
LLPGFGIVLALVRRVVWAGADLASPGIDRFCVCLAVLIVHGQVERAAATQRKAGMLFHATSKCPSLIGSMAGLGGGGLPTL